MSRVYNFSAGPAVLPEPVLEQVQQELLDWEGTGMSVMEMSHRGESFTAIATQAMDDLRELLEIPDDYRVLFLQGGASTQFAALPMNILHGNIHADYVDTGIWSRKAIAEAQRYCQVNIVASGESSGYCRIPEQESWNLDPFAAYVHYTPNETIGGVEFHWLPDTGAIPLVADMSSTLLSRPIDVKRHALIYAGAQKNIGPAGLTIVIVRDDLLGHAAKGTPTMLNYKVHADNWSMYNTPPTFSWYVAGLVFAWLKQLGGLEKMAEINGHKAEKLYNAIDRSSFYSNPIDPSCRSRMNIPFTIASKELEEKFLHETVGEGLVGLKGHRSVGGMRASIYNAMPEEGVDALLAFMKDFEQRYA